MYKIENTFIQGCIELTPNISEDYRGKVIKTFNTDQFINAGITTQFTEDLIVVNKKNVLRGMHFQTYPYEQEKVVMCLEGRILDVLVDLRPQSITFKQHIVIDLNGTNKKMVYIPKGVAHGYYCMEDSMVAYKLSSVYSKQHEAGILWDSCGVNWPSLSPIISEKDTQYLTLEAYVEKNSGR